jgi:exosortase
MNLCIKELGTWNLLHHTVWVLVATLYCPIFYTLYRSRWDAVDYTHAYFILPISLWLVWRKRAQLKELLQEIKPTNNFFSLSILVLGLLMFVFGWRQEYLFVSTLSLVLVLYGLITYLYGLNVAKTLAFPILYLLLLVPPPIGILDSVTLPMRYGSSVATEAVLNLFNYPITREGLLLSLADHEIFMGQPCSGFRSLITMSSLASVYIYISKGGLAKVLILGSSIIPLALLGNLIRVLTICLLTYYFGEDVAQGFFHSFSGIVVFVVIILGLIGLEILLGKLVLSKQSKCVVETK